MRGRLFIHIPSFSDCARFSGLVQELLESSSSGCVMDKGRFLHVAPPRFQHKGGAEASGPTNLGKNSISSGVIDYVPR